MTAYQTEAHGVRLPSSLDVHRFTAYRYVDRDYVVVGVAKTISLDKDGHVVVTPEKGSVMHGRPNRSHDEPSHILVENSAVIPQSLRRS